jgi:gas vesicle protein
MGAGKVVMGIVAGLAAGTAVGMLFAPDKGTETRRKLWEKGEQLKDDVRHRMGSMSDIGDQANDVIMS